MLLTITHHTTYTYDEPVAEGFQRLRLIPRSGATQTVAEWDTEVTGGTKQAVFDDHFGNRTELVKIDPGVSQVQIVSRGVVETLSDSGVVGPNTGYAPVWLFLRPTALTTAGDRVAELVDGLDDPDGDRVAQLHDLTARVAETVRYESGHTEIDDPAERVLEVGRGVCQDHAHVFVAAARHLRIPARYVSGYLMMNATVDQDASHAWAEAWVEPLGWIGFDPSNGISPDARYVRTATGLDYVDAAPISGLRFGPGIETLQVSVQVQQ
jgi:transglutaminase-like putative cysteine protease